MAKQKAIDKLVFREDSHRYSYRGVVVPGVTTVIGSTLLDFSHMPNEVMERARQRGTDVHELTEMLDVDGGYPVSKYDPYVCAWVAFKEDFDFQPDEVEQKVFHSTLLYAGTLDRVGVINGELSVVDIKTGAIYPEYALQLAAYQAAANEGRVGEKIKARYSVQLRDNGTYTVQKYESKADLSVFVAALSIYNWRGMKHGN